jgi:hypothetical protein
MSYRIEKLTAENIHDLLYIYRDAFGREVDLKDLDDKLNTTFAGISYVGFTAYSEDNEPAAFYGVFPCFANYQGKRFLIAQSGNTMTHSKHRGKGLFTILAKKTFEYCAANEINLVFGFPNKNSYPGFVRKLDWIHFDDIEAYLVRVKGISWYRINQFFRLSYNIYDNRCRRILNNLPKAKPFLSSCEKSDVPVVDHSPAFIKYKTYEENFLVDIKGTGVWLKFNKNYLLIGDIENVPEIQLEIVLKSLKRLARRMFIPYIRFQGSTDTDIATFFAKHGEKMEVKHAIAGIQFTKVIPLEKMKFTAADNDTF